ncbi:MAG: membrane-bound serine protease (ClpP class) [Verrucomicrobiales bacterium]|jgi:membrane-bound serine protease (ClpP class)
MLASIIILAVFGIIMLCLEVVLPGAVIGIIGGGLIIASLVLTFTNSEMQDYGPGVQVTLAAGIFVLSIGIFVSWMRYFHKTIIGRHLILNETVGGGTQEKAPEDLTGKTGIAKSDLRPSGTVLIEGTRYEAHSPVGFVTQGTAIRVIGRDGCSLTVTEQVDAATLSNGTNAES